MKGKHVIITALLGLFALAAGAQQYKGTYGFLDATHSPRVAALGGTMLPINDSDIQLGIFNPSLLTAETHNALSLSYVDYFSDINFASIQYARRFEKLGNFSAAVQYHNYGKFDYADEAGHLDGSTFSASDYAFIIGWGRQLDNHFSIGANIKFAGNQYEHDNSFALAVDVAGSYQTESGWMFSLAARNIGRELYRNYDGFRNSMPFKMQVGMAKMLEHLPFMFIVVYDNIQKWDLMYDDPIDLEGNTDALTGEVNKKKGFDKFIDNAFRHVVLGGELYIGKNLIIRGGFNYGRRQDLKIPGKKGAVGFSYGLSIRIKQFNISYSRSEMHIVGSPNYISVTTNLSRFVKKNK